MERRTYLVAAGASVPALLAGCIDSIGSDDGAAGTTGDEPEETEHAAVLATEAYVDAVAAEDDEAMIELMHSTHPFNPANRDNESDVEWSVEWNDVENPDVELRDAEFSTADVAELPSVAFWFEEGELEATLAGEEAALVALEYETTEAGERVDKTETLIALTENDEWKVFFPYEEPAEIPEGEPVADLDVVDELSFDAETEMARVEFVDSVEADVSTVYVYSTSLGQEGWVSGSEETDDFSVNYFTSAFDPAGDEIVVTAVVDGEERVVHREEYEPDE